MRIGESGSYRPMPTNFRRLSKITARSPATPSGRTETTESSNTHGWP